MAKEESGLTEMQLAAKLGMKKLKVMGDIEGLNKDKVAPASIGGFRYVSDEVVLPAVRALLIKYELTVKVSAMAGAIQTFQAYGGKGMSLVVPLVITLTDAETGYAEESNWIGMGADPGDKGLGKAYTMGIKYWLLKTFLVPTGDDVEKGEGQAPGRRPQNGSGSSQGQTQSSAGPGQGQQPPPGTGAGSGINEDGGAKPASGWPAMNDQQRMFMVDVQAYFKSQEVEGKYVFGDQSKLALCQLTFEKLKHWPNNQQDSFALKQQISVMDVLEKVG